jgi:hypothetical protein
MDLKNINLYNKKELPQTLYHYTSLHGLFEIIKTKSIWATDILYLNDASEFEFTKNIIISQLEKNPSDIAVLMINSFDEIFKYLTPHVCSFSERGDLLSQWRGYCPQGSGFSIGFDANKLIENLKNNLFEISQCIYDHKEQEDIIDKLLKEMDDEFIRVPNLNDVTVKEALLMKFISAFFIIAPRMKDESFIEESEWRFTLSLRISSKEGIEHTYREGKSMLIPYLIIPLWEDVRNMPIKEIIIGPTQHKELAYRSLNNFIADSKVGSIEIKYSKIPFRTWSF